MKFIPIAILLCFISLSSHAQSFGLRAGANVANLLVDDQENTSILGYQVGPFVQVGLGPISDINIALLYTLKGTKDEMNQEEAKIHYLELPVLFRYKLAFAFLEFGPYGSYVVSADVEGIDIKDLIKNGDYGLILGAGAGFGNIRADIRYSFGLADIDDLGINEIKNSVLTLGLEFSF